MLKLEKNRLRYGFSKPELSAKKKNITEQGLVNERNSRNQQISAINSINQMQKSLNVLKITRTIS
jgi:hypothetical protein